MEKSPELQQIEEINKALEEVDYHLNKVLQTYFRVVGMMEGRVIPEKDGCNYKAGIKAPSLRVKISRWLHSLKYENN